MVAGTVDWVAVLEDCSHWTDVMGIHSSWAVPVLAASEAPLKVFFLHACRCHSSAVEEGRRIIEEAEQYRVVDLRTVAGPRAVAD